MRNVNLQSHCSFWNKHGDVKTTFSQQQCFLIVIDFCAAAAHNNYGMMLKYFYFEIVAQATKKV